MQCENGVHYREHLIRWLIPAGCDRCGVFPGFDFVDGFWLCQLCRRSYLDQVAKEASEEAMNAR